jgi:hypothetical protein
MALLYFAFAQIPLVGVVVVASAMGRRLPKGVTPSSNLAVVGEGGSAAGMATGRVLSKRMGAKGRAPKKESKCDNNCAKYVTGVAHFKIVFRAVFGL